MLVHCGAPRLQRRWEMHAYKQCQLDQVQTKKNAKKNVKSFQVGLRSIYNTQHSSSFINIKGLDVESRLDTFR